MKILQEREKGIKCDNNRIAVKRSRTDASDKRATDDSQTGRNNRGDSNFHANISRADTYVLIILASSASGLDDWFRDCQACLPLFLALSLFRSTRLVLRNLVLDPPLFLGQVRDRGRRRASSTAERYPSRYPRGPPRSTDYLRAAHRNHQPAPFRGSR